MQDKFIDMLVNAVKLLANYLVDEDVLFIRTVQNTLRQLLSTQPGLDVLQYLEPIERAFIKHFASLKEKDTDVHGPGSSRHDSCYQIAWHVHFSYNA
jgi:hypothetical protein